LLLRELGAFGIVGAVCFMIDLGLFQVLYAGAGLDAVLAKLGSTLVSMTAAYTGHRYWSFSHRARTGLRREYGIFFLINGLTMALGLAAVAFVHHGLGYEDALVLQLTNVASIAVGTLIRFVAYRRWVFVAEDAPAAVMHRRDQERRAAPADDAPVIA
jgi:putative flippase GtrA